MDEEKFYAAFDKYAEFMAAQAEYLALDIFIEPTPEQDRKESTALLALTNILHEYQEQSYLLDPFLEGMVGPVIEHLKTYARTFVANPINRGSSKRLHRISLLIYSYIKFRGYKAITRFFPHEIPDLSIAIDFMLLPGSIAKDPDQWPLRYVVLLWLGLICMIPFDLAQFDEVDGSGRTAVAIESIARQNIDKAGLERDGAALLLARLYTRQDTVKECDAFIHYAQGTIIGPPDSITLLGVLQILCEVVKIGTSALLEDILPRLVVLAKHLENVESLSTNTTVRTYKTKLISRIALRLLPSRNSTRRKGRTLTGIEKEAFDEQDYVDIPEDLEDLLNPLLNTLQDKDTVVRYSAAKGVARIAERLPEDYSDQILENVIDFFKIHSTTAASLYDLPAIAENTWHGVCLCCAEMARRGLVAPKRLPELIEWLSKALYFDLRKGSHSIGSSVRDAASYVLWALARTQRPCDLEPYADNLARKLVTVSLFDREIHIRRASSAAFQEFVGRTNLFPHGISVLRKTDFYAVSIRRNAFLVAAPQVAEHLEYRMFLFDHLLNVTLRHWDLTMRTLASQSLKLICMTDLPVLAPEAILRTVKLLDSVDLTDLHGSLLAMTEIATAYKEASQDSDLLEGQLQGIFKNLANIPEKVLLETRNEIVIAAACHLVANTITLTEIHLQERTSVPCWRKLIDHALKHRSNQVQEAGAVAMSAVSRLVDCSPMVISTLIKELKKGTFTKQQSMGRLLGVIDYDSFPTCLSQSLNALVECISPGPAFLSNVEARRNCFLAIPQILSNVIQHLPHRIPNETVVVLFDTLLGGLDDYTIDERGDVGSWIRIACLQGLTTFCELIITNAASIDLNVLLPTHKYHEAVGRILRQGVERLDNVRQEAGSSFVKLLSLSPPSIPHGEEWVPYHAEFFRGLLGNETELRWNDGNWLFPKAVRFLDATEYRKHILVGLVASLGSKTDSIHRPLADSLVAYIQQLPVQAEAGSPYDVIQYLRDLHDHAKAQLSNNGVVIPVIQTYNILLEAEALDGLTDHEDGIKCLRIFHAMITRPADRLKNIQRIHESMKLAANLLRIRPLYTVCLQSMTKFLAHKYPTVRSDSAEFLYICLQSVMLDVDTEEAENVLLQTEWSSPDTDVVSEAGKVVKLLTLP